jgi:hypothetical protein
MFNEINNNFDATLEKTEVLTESMANLYDIDRYYMIEGFSDDITDEELDEFTESLDAFNSKVKKIFKSMIEAVRKFTKDLIETIKKKINDVEFKLKMKKLRKVLDLNKDFVYKAENPNDYTFKTYADAIAFFDKIVNDADTMLKVLTTKKFEEREDWDEYATKLINAYNEKMIKIAGSMDFKFQIPNNKTAVVVLKYATDKIKESAAILKKLDSIVEKHIKNAVDASIKDTEPTHVSVYQKISNIVVKTGKKIKSAVAKYPLTTFNVLMSALTVAISRHGIKTMGDAILVGDSIALSTGVALAGDKMTQRINRKKQEEEKANRMTKESVDAFDIFDNMTLDEFTESLNSGDDLDSLLESATSFDSLINDIDDSYYESTDELDFFTIFDDLNF